MADEPERLDGYLAARDNRRFLALQALVVGPAATAGTRQDIEIEHAEKLAALIPRPAVNVLVYHGCPRPAAALALAGRPLRPPP